MTNTDKDLTKKVIEILPFLNTAIKNIRLYPPTSASVSGAIDRLYLALSKLLAEEEHIFFTESEKSLLICGKSLLQKDQEKFLTLALLGVLTGHGIRSISFRRGLEKDELGRFIGLLAGNPDTIQTEGGLNKKITDLNIVHADIDQKVYVAMDRSHQVLASIDTTDDQVTRFFMLSQPGMDPGSPQFAERARNPETMSRAFEAGLSKILGQKEHLSSVQLFENLDNLLSLVDNIAEGLDADNQLTLARETGQALIKADRALAEQLSHRNIQYLLGGHLSRYLTEELTQNRLSTAKQDDHADEQENKLLQIADKFGIRLQDSRTLLDEGLMAYLPKIVEQLLAQRHQEAMEKLLERLAANLQSGNSDVRSRAARNLADLLERFPGEVRTQVVERLSESLIAWLKNESVFSSEYERICGIVKNVTKDHLAQKQFDAALKYLDALNAVVESSAEITGTAKTLAMNLLGQLAEPETMDVILEEISSPDGVRKAEASRLLAALGANAVDDLLDQLLSNNDSDERVRIMHVIASLREKALPIIISRIEQEAPWFYLRNLAYLLGQIGQEDTARFLAPLLEHGNDKVRQEALKSLYKIGGKHRGSILLAALRGADEDFKVNIVDVLGQSKSIEAVPVLIDLLKNRPLIASTARTALEEKICIALGAIGSADATGPLSEIASAKSFLNLRSYPDKVKAAAASSLRALKKKIAQS